MGSNLSQVDGDQVYGYKKIGLNTGVSAMIPLGRRFYIVPEILYSEKGSYQKPEYIDEDSTGEYRLRLNYAEVPILLQYADKNGFIFGAGISYGRLVHVKEKEYNRISREIEWNNVSLNDGTYKKSDYDILADLRLRIFKGFYFNLRYSYSITKIRTRYFPKPWNKTRDQFNNLLSFRVVWIINDRYENLTETENVRNVR